MKENDTGGSIRYGGSDEAVESAAPAHIRSYAPLPDYIDPHEMTTGSRMRSQPLSSLHKHNYPPLVWYVGELDEHGAIYWVCDHKHSSDLEALGCAYTALQHYRAITPKGK